MSAKIDGSMLTVSINNVIEGRCLYIGSIELLCFVMFNNIWTYVIGKYSEQISSEVRIITNPQNRNSE